MEVQAETLPTRVLLLEPNAALRSAILALLAAEQYRVEQCHSLEELQKHTDRTAQTIALVAWQSMEGLLVDEHRHDLLELTRRLRLVLMVPRRWARLLESTDLSSTVAALVAKPFDADELLNTLKSVLAIRVEN